MCLTWFIMRSSWLPSCYTIETTLLDCIKITGAHLRHMLSHICYYDLNISLLEINLYYNKRGISKVLVSWNIAQLRQVCFTTEISHLYRVIHKSLRNFRTRLRNNQDRHGRKEHTNRYRISQSFFFVLGALAYLQVPPLGGSRDE